jgi:hypothetical protein
MAEGLTVGSVRTIPRQFLNLQTALVLAVYNSNTLKPNNLSLNLFNIASTSPRYSQGNLLINPMAKPRQIS